MEAQAPLPGQSKQLWTSESHRIPQANDSIYTFSSSHASANEVLEENLTKNEVLLAASSSLAALDAAFVERQAF